MWACMFFAHIMRRLPRLINAGSPKGRFPAYAVTTWLRLSSTVPILLICEGDVYTGGR